mgnify:CR=1 FL=1
MANIRKRRGKWTVSIRKSNYPPVYKTFLDKPTARKWARKVESDMDRNQFEDYSDASKTLLTQLLQRYKEEMTVKKKGARSETYRLNWLMRHKISKINLMRLQSKHIYALKSELTERNLKPQTVKHYIHLLSVVWNTAKKVWGIHLPAQSPFELVVLDKVNNTRDRVLDSKEYSKLLEVADRSKYNFMKDLLQFLYVTGGRWSEVINLKDVMFSSMKDLSNECIKILKRYPFGDTFFPIKYRDYYDEFRRICKVAELANFTTHDLRSCAIVNMLKSGMNIAEVRVISGHKSLSQFQRYARIKPSDLLDKINQV